MFTPTLLSYVDHVGHTACFSSFPKFVNPESNPINSTTLYAVKMTIDHLVAINSFDTGICLDAVASLNAFLFDVFLGRLLNLEPQHGQ